MFPHCFIYSLQIEDRIDLIENGLRLIYSVSWNSAKRNHTHQTGIVIEKYIDRVVLHKRISFIVGN